MLFEDVGKSAKPRAAFNDDGAILPLSVSWFEQVARTVAFKRTAAGTKAYKAERGGLVVGMESNTRLFASAVVVGRIKRLVRVYGTSTTSIATAASAATYAWISWRMRCRAMMLRRRRWRL